METNPVETEPVETEPLGLVMAGAGARGAYEAGALAAWLRHHPDEPRPTILLGTSSGAINVLLLASMAHLDDSGTVADEISRRWRESDRSTVFAPVIPSGLLAGIRYAAVVLGGGICRRLGLPRPRLLRVLNNAPLRATVQDPQWLDWNRLHDNVKSGRVSAVGAVATRVSDGRSVVFLELAPGFTCPPNDDARGIDYMQVTLGPQHLLASAAIPAMFRAQQVQRPNGDDNWYIDGGAGLNTPIKPALELGARRLVVVSSNSDNRVPRAPGTSTPPDVFDAASQVMRSSLAAGMIEDLTTLRSINHILDSLPAGTPAPATAGSSTRRLRRVPHCFLGPGDDQEIGKTLRRVYDETYGTLRRRLRRPDFPILSAVFDGGTIIHDDLVSNYFFERTFLNALVDLGQRDAQARLATEARAQS